VSAAGLDLDYRQRLADTGAGHRGVTAARRSRVGVR
jgi:hypothetical protein